MLRTLLFHFSVVLLASQAASATPVHVLTCDEAKEEVARTGRYYVETPDGEIPIYPVKAIHPRWGAYCTGPREVPSFHVRKTRDQYKCVVGYACISNPK